MTDHAPSFRSMLVTLRSGYLQMGIQTTRLLKMLDIDPEPFLSARAAALEESGVDAVIARDKDIGASVSEQEVRAFAAVAKKGVELACLALVEMHKYDPQVIWETEARTAGVDKLLGIGSYVPPSKRLRK